MHRLETTLGLRKANEACLVMCLNNDLARANSCVPALIRQIFPPVLCSLHVIFVWIGHAVHILQTPRRFSALAFIWRFILTTNNLCRSSNLLGLKSWYLNSTCIRLEPLSSGDFTGVLFVFRNYRNFNSLEKSVCNMPLILHIAYLSIVDEFEFLTFEGFWSQQDLWMIYA